MRDIQRSLRSTVISGLLFAAAFGLVACGLFASDPRSVARDFWSAVEAQDFEAARAAATSTDLRRLEEVARASDGYDASFGETIANEETARVPTTFVDLEGNAFEFDTHLTHLDGDWRVDAALTHRELRQAAFAASLRDARDALGEAGRVLGEAIEEGAREATRAMRDAIEELEEPQRDGREL